MSSHMIRGRQLSRDTEHRISLRRSLVQSLFEHGKIKTTGPKAKEVKAFAEKLINLARTGPLSARRREVGVVRPVVHRSKSQRDRSAHRIGPVFFLQYRPRLTVNQTTDAGAPAGARIVSHPTRLSWSTHAQPQADGVCDHLRKL